MNTFPFCFSQLFFPQIVMWLCFYGIFRVVNQDSYVTSGETEYIETKLIKNGFKELDGPLAKHGDRIFDKYGVSPLNLYYDILQHNKQPRLRVIVEYYADAKALKGKEDAITKGFR